MATIEFRAGVLTVSDKGSKGEREDKSGAAIKEILKQVPCQVTLALFGVLRCVRPVRCD